MAPIMPAVAAAALTQPDPRREAPALLTATLRDWVTLPGNVKTGPTLGRRLEVALR